jgi:hypothetical protein
MQRLKALGSLSPPNNWPQEKLRMRRTIGLSRIATTLVVMLLASNSAFSYDATAFEKAELAQLTPQLRSQVEARMTGGQTVRGVLETMLLNNISQLFAANRIVAIDSDKGVAVVEGANGQVRAFNFDVATLVIKA